MCIRDRYKIFHPVFPDKEDYQRTAIYVHVYGVPLFLRAVRFNDADCQPFNPLAHLCRYHGQLRACLLYTSCDKLRAMDNVKVYPFQDILDFTGDSKLTGVHFKSTETGEENTVSCDGVFEYIGLTPTTEFLADFGVLNKFGYVEVDEKMHTKVAGVYGAGDCVTKNLRQVITACADGAIAAQEASHYVQNLED